MQYTTDAYVDEVKSLPGQIHELASRQFSGFLQITPTKFIHYYFFESENDPVNDPVIFWTNGGPGCSGMLGLFTEMGPLRPIEDGQITRNPWTWTKLSSMVFLEQPAGVGFSYSTDDSILTDFNDYRASIDNVRIIRSFFDKFPSLRKNAFYLASESYGGHYIPHWTYQLFDNNENSDLRETFKGYLVGNPFTSFASGSIGMTNVMWGLQLIPKPAWDLFTASTCDLLSHDAYFLSLYLPQCFEYLDALDEYVVSLNPYALEFPVCAKQVLYMQNQAKEGKWNDRTHWTKYPKLSAQGRFHLETMKRIKNELSTKGKEHRPHYEEMKALLGDETHDKYHHTRITVPSKLKPHTTLQQSDNDSLVSPDRDVRALQYDACSEYYSYEYLNDEAVQEALHVGKSSSRGQYFLNTRNEPERMSWAPCSDSVNGGWAFNDYLADTTILYSKIVQHKNKPKDFKMLVFSGDSDGVCATVGTQNWIYDVKGADIVSLYKPWYYNDTNYGHQPGGYLTQFTNYFSFATVHFAGHEVPAYQPEKALSLFAAYLNGSIFAGYSAMIASASSSSTDSVTSPSPHSGDSHVVPVVIAILLAITAIGGLIICLLPKKFEDSSKDFERTDSGIELTHNPGRGVTNLE
eukprot:gene9227-10016_t